MSLKDEHIKNGNHQDASQYTFFKDTEPSELLDGALEDGVEIPPEEQENLKDFLQGDHVLEDILNEQQQNISNEQKNYKDGAQENSFDQLAFLLQDSVNMDDVSSQLKGLNLSQDVNETVQGLQNTNLKGQEESLLYSNLYDNKGKGAIDFMKLFNPDSNLNGNKDFKFESTKSENLKENGQQNFDAQNFGDSDGSLSEQQLQEAQKYFGNQLNMRPNLQDPNSQFMYPNYKPSNQTDQSNSQAMKSNQNPGFDFSSFQNGMSSPAQNNDSTPYSLQNSNQGQGQGQNFSSAASNGSQQGLHSMLPGLSQSLVNNKTFPKSNPLLLNTRVTTPYTPGSYSASPNSFSTFMSQGGQTPSSQQQLQNQQLSNPMNIQQILHNYQYPQGNHNLMNNFQNLNMLRNQAAHLGQSGQVPPNTGKAMPQNGNIDSLLSQIGKQQGINPEVLRELSLQNQQGILQDQFGGKMDQGTNQLKQFQNFTQGNGQNPGGNAGNNNLANLGNNGGLNGNRQFSAQLIPGLMGHVQNGGIQNGGIQNKNQFMQMQQSAGGQFGLNNPPRNFSGGAPQINNSNFDSANQQQMASLKLRLQNYFNQQGGVQGQQGLQQGIGEKQYSQYFNKVLLSLNKEIMETYPIQDPQLRAYGIKKKMMDLEQPLQKLAQERIGLIFADRQLGQQQSMGVNMDVPRARPLDLMQWQLQAKQFLELAEEIKAFRLNDQQVDMNYVQSLQRIQQLQYQRQVLLQQQQQQQQLQTQNSFDQQRQSVLQRALEQQRLRDIIRGGSINNGFQQNKVLNQNYIDNLALLQRLNAQKQSQKFFN